MNESASLTLSDRSVYLMCGPNRLNFDTGMGEVDVKVPPQETQVALIQQLIESARERGSSVAIIFGDASYDSGKIVAWASLKSLTVTESGRKVYSYEQLTRLTRRRASSLKKTSDGEPIAEGIRRGSFVVETPDYLETSAKRTGSRTFLLTWNPERWEWNTFGEDLATIALGRAVDMRWTSGNNQRISEGDHVFLLKQGAPPRGIIASGTVTRGVFEEAHWERERAAAGDTSNFIRVSLDRLVSHERILAVEQLKKVVPRPVNWQPMASGTEIPGDCVPAIKALWDSHAPPPQWRAVHQGVSLRPGNVYSWNELGERFGFKGNYFGVAGGMISRPEHNALLLVTHPGGADSFDYEDYWEEDDLVYSGRGLTGDQKLEGPNLDLAQNAKQLYVFQPSGPKRLEFIGEPTCVEYFWGEAADTNGVARKLLRFRLRFDAAVESLASYRANEGKRMSVVHDRFERDPALIAAAKRLWRERDAALRCEVCEFSFAEQYGDVGVDYIEAHHRVPLSQLQGIATETTVESLAPLCANCHRMLHRRNVTIESLRALVSKRS